MNKTSYIIFLVLFTVLLSNSVFADPLIPPQEADRRYSMSICMKLVSCMDVNKPIDGCLKATMKEYTTTEPKIELSTMTKCTYEVLSLTCDQIKESKTNPSVLHTENCMALGNVMAPLQKQEAQ